MNFYNPIPPTKYKEPAALPGSTPLTGMSRIDLFYIINGVQWYSLNLFLQRNTFNRANTDVPHRYYPRSFWFGCSTG
jgi:hypothetical protein